MLERIKQLSERLEELDSEKQRVIEEIESMVEFASREELTPDFINYYYWETDFKVSLIKEALRMPMVQRSKREYAFDCLKCGKEIKLEVNSRTAYREMGVKYRKAQKTGRITYFPEIKVVENVEFLCPVCFEKLQKDHRKIRKEISGCKYGKWDINWGNYSVEELKEMPYEDYLHTVHWRSFANEMKSNARYRCQKCGTNKGILDVHHLTYERRGCEKSEDVMVLCRSCHELEHNR